MATSVPRTRYVYMNADGGGQSDVKRLLDYV